MSHKDLLVNPITKETSFRSEIVISSYESSFKQIQAKKFIKYHFDRINILTNLIKHRLFKVSDENDNLKFYYDSFETAIKVYDKFDKTLIQSYFNPQELHVIIDDLKQHFTTSPDNILSIYYFLILTYINDYFIPLYNKVYTYLKPKYSITRIINTLRTILKTIQDNLHLQYNPSISILFSSLLILLNQYDLFETIYVNCLNIKNDLENIFKNFHKNLMFEYTLKISDYKNNKSFCKMCNCNDKIIDNITTITKNINKFYYQIYKSINYKNEILIITQLINLYKITLKQANVMPELNILKIDINEHLKEIAELEDTIIKEYEEAHQKLRLQFFEQNLQNKETMTDIILYKKVPKIPTLILSPPLLSPSLGSSSAASSSMTRSRSSSSEFNDFNRLSPTNYGDDVFPDALSPTFKLVSPKTPLISPKTPLISPKTSLISPKTPRRKNSDEFETNEFKPPKFEIQFLKN